MNPQAKILVVANPSNGPGMKANPDYVSGIDALVSSGVGMAGYVFTKYGSRPIEDVQQDLSTWSKLYPKVTSTFMDNMSNKPGHEEYYSQLPNREVPRQQEGNRKPGSSCSYILPRDSGCDGNLRRRWLPNLSPGTVD